MAYLYFIVYFCPNDIKGAGKTEELPANIPCKEMQELDIEETEMYSLIKESDDDEEIKIVRSKRYDLKPMYPEDACVQMELLGHNFFVFSNAETDEVNVVYKRKGDTYGLIEPEC